MNRLLAYLLERQGQVINRDELLDNVWDLHGLRSSNHTLNKYISEIRKHFVSTGAGTNRRYSAFPKKHRIIFNVVLLLMFVTSIVIFYAGSQISKKKQSP